MRPYDVLIVGGGIVGAVTARALSAHALSLALLEKESDVGTGATKGNSAIVHAGFDPVPGTWKAKLNRIGNAALEPLCRTLHVPFVRNGSLVIAFSEEELRAIESLIDRGRENGIPGLALLDPAALHALEPAVAPDALGALHAPTGGIFGPYELTVAATEVAVANGMDLLRNHRVVAIRPDPPPPAVPAPDGARFTVVADACRPDGTACERREFRARFVLDAAGVYADEVAALAGDRRLSIHPRKGEYLLLDKRQGALVKNTCFRAPSAMGKGVLVSPTVDGNLLVGPTAVDQTDKEDTSTTAEGLASVLAQGRRSVPGVDPSAVLTSFAGLRAVSSGHDFVLEESPLVPGLILAAGIESPGLVSSPAIADRLLAVLADAGLDLVPRPDARMDRDEPVRFRELDDAARAALIAKDPRYGHVLCRCERVTEGEILDAIRRPGGARDLDAVKRRTRAGMGRCQSGFCLPRVAEVLARELSAEEASLTKKGPGSALVEGRLR